MNKKESQQRKRNRIGCQLNDKEYVEFKNILAESKMTQQDFIKNAVFNAKVINTDGIRELLPQLAKLGGNLNQIAYKLNSGEVVSKDMEGSLFIIQVGLSDIWQSLKLFLQKQS